MNRPRPLPDVLLVSIAIVILLLGASPGRAELSASPDDYLSYLLFGIIEGPDPIPPHLWQPYGDATDALNVDGAVRMDGRPSIVLAPGTQWPLVVWSYDTGTDGDIAFNGWDGAAWQPQNTFLTSSTADELDPRIHVSADGTLRVVWWEDTGPGRVLLVERDPVSQLWGVPFVVSNSGRRPTVTVHEDRSLVAFERTAEGGNEIVLATEQVSGGFSFEAIHLAPRLIGLDVVLHVKSGRLWIDWKDDATHFGFSEYVQGVWQFPTLITWDDSSWIGEEVTRREIQFDLLTP